MNAKLWTNLLNEFTRELMYEAEMACVSSNLSFSNELTLKVDAFSDSIETFVKLYFEKLVKFDVKNLRSDFYVQLEKLKKTLLNFFKQQPYSQGATYNEYILLTRTFSPKSLLEQVEKITFESFLNFHEHFLRSLRIELLVSGNINADNAKILSEIAVEQLFKKRNAIPLQKVIHFPLKIQTAKH